MTSQLLLQRSAQWSRKVPKKYKPQLITEVHNILIEDPIAANFQWLVKSNYFQNVLWEFFDPDAMVSHIELIVILCLYDLKSGSLALLGVMTGGDDQPKQDRFLKLIIRLLNITFDVRPDHSNFRLHRLIIQLFTELLAIDSNKNIPTLFAIISHTVKDQAVITTMGPPHLLTSWLTNLLTANVECLYIKHEDFQYIEYLKAVVLFLSLLRSQYSNCLDDLPLTGLNFRIKFGFIDFFKILVPKYDRDYYEIFKACFQHQYGKNITWNKLLEFPSVYDIDRSEWFKLMDSLSFQDLEHINSSIEIPKIASKSKEVLMNSIGYHILNWQIHHCLELNEWNETTVFDRFNFPAASSSFKFNLPIESNSGVNFEYDLKYQIYTHLLSVLTRLNISLDRSKKLVINGKSKYFHQIHSIETEGDESVIQTSGNVSDFENGLVILLEINSPNKYSTFKRVQEFGLELFSIRKVSSMINKNKHLYLKVLDLQQNEQEKFNYLIHMDTKVVSWYEKQHHYKFPLPLNNVNLTQTQIQKQTQTSLTLTGGIPNTFLKDKFSVKDNKKRTINEDSGQFKTVKLDLTDNTCEVIDDNLCEIPLLKQEVDSIYTSLTNKMSLVEMVPNGTNKLLNDLIGNIHENFKDESVLIICPNLNWVESLQLPPKLIPKTGKLLNKLTDMPDPLEQIESLLNKTRSLAAFLNLNEQYYSDSVENALCLYKLEIPRIWNDYLLKIGDDNFDHIKDFPFEALTRDASIQQVVNSYYTITKMGHDLSRLAPVMKFPHNELKVKQYLLMNFHQFIIIGQEQLINDDIPGISSKYFDNVIFIDSNSIHKAAASLVLHLPYKRLIVIGDKPAMDPCSIYYDLYHHKDIPHTHIPQSFCNTDIFKMYSQEYPEIECESTGNEFTDKSIDLKYSIQNIPIKTNENSQVSVAEAQSTIGIFNYLNTKTKDVCIVSNSPFQRALFEEMKPQHKFFKLEHIDELSSHDYLIVSCFGYSGIYDLLKCIKRCRRGIYLVGDIQEPLDIHKGALEIKRHNKFIKVQDIDELR